MYSASHLNSSCSFFLSCDALKWFGTYYCRGPQVPPSSGSQPPWTLRAVRSGELQGLSEGWNSKNLSDHTSYPLNCGILSSRRAKICTVYSCWTTAEVRLSEQFEAEIVQDTGSSTGHLQGTCGEGGKCEELAAAAETGK